MIDGWRTTGGGWRWWWWWNLSILSSVNTSHKIRHEWSHGLHRNHESHMIWFLHYLPVGVTPNSIFISIREQFKDAQARSRISKMATVMRLMMATSSRPMTMGPALSWAAISCSSDHWGSWFSSSWKMKQLIMMSSYVVCNGSPQSAYVLMFGVLYTYWHYEYEINKAH